MSRKITRLSLTISAFMVLAMGTACGPQDKGVSGAVTEGSGQVTIGGPFTLVDHHGKTVTQADYAGRPQLIYFGYSYCPDVCPTALQQMGAALSLAGDAADYYQPIFISVDYERDTPAQLALYVTANGFPKNLVGLTGTPQQIEAAKKAFSVYAVKVDNDDYPDDFIYDHSSMIYMMDEQGKYIAYFTHADSPAKIAERLIAYKKTGR